MKIKVIKVFDDLKAKVTRKENEVFEVSPERFKEINGSAYGTLAVEVNEHETATGEDHESSKKKTTTKRTAVTDKK